MNRLPSVFTSLVVPALVLAGATILPAQTPDRPNLVLSIYGGVTSGHSLWSLPRQPLCVLLGPPPNYNGCEQNSGGDVNDTLAVSRDIASSVVLGASFEYFPVSHIGFQGEMYYLGLSFNDRCGNVTPYNPDSESKNQQTCQNFATTGASASAVSFIGSVILRAAPHGLISPYVRAGAGFTAYTGGTLAASGSFASSAIDPTTGGPYVLTRTIVLDTTPKTTSWTFQFAGGFTTRLSPGYQVRLEVRDAVLPLERLLGPANSSGIAPHQTKVYHEIGLVIGLDVVLEHRRGHRY